MYHFGFPFALLSTYAKCQHVFILVALFLKGTGQGDTLILNGSVDPETAALHILKGQNFVFLSL